MAFYGLLADWFLPGLLDPNCSDQLDSVYISFLSSISTTGATEHAQVSEKYVCIAHIVPPRSFAIIVCGMQCDNNSLSDWK